MAEKTVFKGRSLDCSRDQDVAYIQFNNENSSVNKFDSATLEELQTAVGLIQKESGLEGLIFSSAKEAFIVGADITEFLSFFKKDSVEPWLEKTHKIFNSIEDLPFPTVSAIHGFCLGGGFELVLSTSFRITSHDAKVGLPETKLGIIPGWGGCVRLPRLVGSDNAIEWIAGGKAWSPEDALRIGAIDAIVEKDKLVSSALKMIKDAGSGKLNWEKRKTQKVSPLQFHSPIEKQMAIESARAFVGAQAGKHYPAPLEAINVIDATADMGRDEALPIERKSFAKLAKTNCAESLVSIFLSGQYNKKRVKAFTKLAKPVNKAGVLGAGIMGGGIAYQSASRGVPVLMKDISESSLEKGLEEASSLLTKQLERKKINTKQMTHVLSSISPTLNYGDFGNVDLVIEAVVENENVKKSVLTELGQHVKKGTVIASNTSTIPIDNLAGAASEAENFCGMHFFNPVHRMPLVEVIRGEKTSDEAVGTVVQYALKMGKTPIVVRDCPGFLVNRVLFPYFWGFFSLLTEGAHPYEVDKVMESFGWPMGPAYLLDVIGIDTAYHAQKIMSEAYPDRMPLDEPSLLAKMTSEKSLGQKTNKGFYEYNLDKKGKLKKVPDSQIENFLSPFVKSHKKHSKEEIEERVMTPLINESVRCLMDGIVDSPQELDLALINGIGFPPFLGGALKYLDSIGLSKYLEKTKNYESLGQAYAAPKLVEENVASGKTFYKL